MVLVAWKSSTRSVASELGIQEGNNITARQDTLPQPPSAVSAFKLRRLKRVVLKALQTNVSDLLPHLLTQVSRKNRNSILPPFLPRRQSRIDTGSYRRTPYSVPLRS